MDQAVFVLGASVSLTIYFGKKPRTTDATKCQTYKGDCCTTNPVLDSYPGDQDNTLSQKTCNTQENWKQDCKEDCEKC